MKSFAAILFLSLATASFGQTIPNIAGSWTISATSQQSGVTTLVGNFVQNGGSISGTVNVTSQCIQSGQFSGTVNANGFMSITISAITFTGTFTLSGNSASGTWTTPVSSCARGDNGTWVATRLAPVLNIAQIADGSSWQTSFQVVNLDVMPVNYAFTFTGDNGSPMPLPLVNGTAGSFSGTLPVGGTAFAQTPGTAASLMEGWASVTSSGQIGILTIFNQTITNRPVSEGTVLGVQSGADVFMPFDNTNGYSTGFAISNSNTTQTLNVSLLFTADNGTQTSGMLILGPLTHTAASITAANMFPALAGVRGSMKLTAATPDITVVGLRFAPGGLSFTSLGEFLYTPVSTTANAGL